VLIDKFLSHDLGDMDGVTLSEKKPLEARWIARDMSASQAKGYGGAPEGSVAIIPLKGDMIKEGTRCSYGTEEVAAALREAAQSEGIIGIMLDVDSGGGAVDAIAPMTEAIAYAQGLRKPVVASCDLCASAAYYVACHCDRVMASNAISSEFGSIGVMTQFVDYAKYYEQHGVKIHTVYSDLSTYKNAPFEAALKGDYKAVKEEVLNPLARQFQQAVRLHRRQLNAEVEGILAGRMFWATDAKANGLIDAIGTADQAVEEVRRLAADRQIARYAGSL
jgi:protease-4